MRIFVAIMFSLLSVFTSKATDYDSIWKSVRLAEEKDLPKDAMSVLQKIQSAARRDKAYGELLASQVYHARIQAEVTPDSLTPAINRLKHEAVDAERIDPVLAMVYNAVMARMCMLTKDYAEATDEVPVLTSEQYFDKALANPDLLASTRTDAFKRLVNVEDDDVIYNHDLLSLIAHEAGRHDFLRQYYDAKGNRKAACVELYLHVLKSVWNDDEQSLQHRLNMLRDGIDKYIDIPESMLLSYCYFKLLSNDYDVTQQQKYDYIINSIKSFKDRYNDGKEYQNNLFNCLNEVTSQQISVLFGQNDSIELREMRNIKELQIDFIRLNCNGRRSFNTYEKGWIKNAMKLADGYSYTVKREYDEPAWLIHKDMLAMPDIPYGVYLIKVTTDTPAADTVAGKDVGKPSSKIEDYNILYHTGLNVLTLQTGEDGQRRIAVINRITGLPVSGAKVILSQTDYSGKVKATTTLTTDAHGETQFGGSFMPNRIWVCHDSKNGTEKDVAFKENYIRDVFNFYHWSEIKDVINVFTDRAIYRPGQMLKASVVVYNSANEDSIHCVAEKNVNVRIFNADYKEIYSTEVKTDRLGNAGFEFMLPEGEKNGMWNIRCTADGAADSSTSFRMEEYKRPAFEVNIENHEQFDKPVIIRRSENDTIVAVRVKTASYSQIPVEGAMVKYSVNRRQQPFWWYYDFDNREKAIVSSAETTTDAYGFADIEFKASIPENDFHRYVFTVNAVVTDKSGETHDISQRIFVQRSRTNELTVTEEREPVKPKEEFEVSDVVFPRNGGKVVFTMRNPGSGKTHAYFAIFANEKVIESGQLDFEGEYHREFVYSKVYGEALTIAYAWQKNGQLHSYNVSIAKPKPETELPVKWKTFRDRTLPGSIEIWTLSVGNAKEHPLSSLMATIYDKSLDAIVPFNWNFALRLSSYNIYTSWQKIDKPNVSLSCASDVISVNGKTQFSYAHLKSEYMPYRAYYGRQLKSGKSVYKRVYSKANTVMPMAAVAVEESASLNEVVVLNSGSNNDTTSEDQTQEPTVDLSALVRTELGESAFFSHSLVSDVDGNITLQFQLPETMTTWRMQGFVHDEHMRFSMLDTSCVAKKDIVVKPNVPRFLREGDKTVLAATISNTTAKLIKANVVMQLIIPGTEKVVWQKSETISLEAEATDAVAFEAPAITADSLLVYRVAATADNGASDGEQHYIPVCPAWELVTTSLAFTQHEPGTYQKDISDLFFKSSTSRLVTVKYTPDAVLMIAEAIPSATHPENKDALSLATATYVATLFNNNDTLRQSVTKELSELQLSDGSWSWWKGMKGSIWTTTSVSRLLARLDYLHTGNIDTGAMLTKALPFIMDYLKEEASYLRKMKKENPKLELYPSETVLDIMYVFAILKQVGNSKSIQLLNTNSKDVNYIISLIEKLSPQMTIYGKARTASLLAYYGKTKRAKEFLESMKQYSVYTDEAGRYYDSPNAYYSWRNYRIPTEVAAIEALRSVLPDDVKTVNEMKRWLLHEKRTQQWDNSVNTADAVFAFMLGEDITKYNKVEDSPSYEGIDITLDGHHVVCDTALSVRDAYDFSVKKATAGTSWGAIFVEQHVPLSSIRNKEMGFTVKREVISANKQLHVGDRVTVRITIDADRDYDFVRVTDNRAACLEPVEQLSGYRTATTGGTALWSYSGYYRQMRDSSSEFYFDRLAKGTHVIETDYFVDRLGDYQQGSCSVSCEYAPEFNAIYCGQEISVEN